MVLYKNTTGWTVNMFGEHGELFSICPYGTRNIKCNITVIPTGVIRIVEQTKKEHSRKKVIITKEPAEKEKENNKEGEI